MNHETKCREVALEIKRQCLQKQHGDNHIYAGSIYDILIENFAPPQVSDERIEECLRSINEKRRSSNLLLLNAGQICDFRSAIKEYFQNFNSGVEKADNKSEYGNATPNQRCHICHKRHDEPGEIYCSGWHTPSVPPVKTLSKPETEKEVEAQCSAKKDQHVKSAPIGDRLAGETCKGTRPVTTVERANTYGGGSHWQHEQSVVETSEGSTPSSSTKSHGTFRELNAEVDWKRFYALYVAKVRSGKYDTEEDAVKSAFLEVRG